MTKTIKVEVLFDDEIATGKEFPDPKFFPAGEVIDVPEASAKSLIEARRVREVKATAKAKASNG